MALTPIKSLLLVTLFLILSLIALVMFTNDIKNFPLITSKPEYFDTDPMGCKRSSFQDKNASFSLVVCPSHENVSAGFSGWATGRVIITIKREEDFEDFPLSKNSHWERYFREKIGPDSFYSALVGPEVHFLGIPKFSRNDSSYTYNYSLGLDGQYTLVVYHLTTAYEGVEEISKELRRYHRRLIFSLTLDVVGEKTVEAMLSEHYRKPTCAPRNEFNGRWVYGTFSRGRTWVSTCFPECLRFLGRKYLQGEWKEARTGLQWVPYNCQMRSFQNSSEVRQCLSGKSVIFVGDSHARTMASRLLYPFLEFPPFSTNASEDLKDVHGFCSRCTSGCSFPNYGNIKISKSKTPACSFSILNPPPNKDITIEYWTCKHGHCKLAPGGFQYVNFGHWPAASKDHLGQWPLDRYKEEVDWLANQFRRRKGVFWFQTVPKIMDMDSNAYSSLIRLSLMNQISDEAMHKRNIPVLKCFQLLASVPGNNRGHYLSFQLDVIIAWILNEICPLKH